MMMVMTSIFISHDSINLTAQCTERFFFLRVNLKGDRGDIEKIIIR